MFDLTLLQGAITGLNTAGKIAKSFLELKSLADVQGKVIDLQSIILSAQSSALAAQSEQSTMIQRISNLEEEITRVKAWEETKKRYELYEPGPGIYVWSLKEQSHASEPPHWICAKCYEDGKRSIIQKKNEGMASTYYICFECKSEFHITKPGGGQPRVVRGPRGGSSNWMG